MLKIDKLERIILKYNNLQFFEIANSIGLRLIQTDARVAIG